jgi:hypothetical protein
MIQVHRRKIPPTQSKNSHMEHLSPRGRTIRNHQQLRCCDRCLWRGEPRTSTVPLRVQRVDNGSILVSLSQVMIKLSLGRWGTIEGDARQIVLVDDIAVILGVKVAHLILQDQCPRRRTRRDERGGRLFGESQKIWHLQISWWVQ